MKKYYFITIIATLIIVSLQAYYLLGLYNDYKTKYIINIKKISQIALDKELYLRERPSIKNTDSLFNIPIKAADDMTSQEKDSLLKITKPGDTISIDKAREAGVGTTIGEIFAQIAQDNAIQQGSIPNLNTIDSLYIAHSQSHDSHLFILYNKDKQPINAVGYVKDSPFIFSSKLYPIGTKGLLYIQLKVHIPISDFIKHQLLTLVLSVCLMLIAMLCLIYQLTAIKRKNDLLLKREASVNGTIHDLKAPLNGVIMMLSWLKITELDTEKKELLQLNQANVRNLVCQIESLLITARKDRQKIVLNKSEVDIDSIIERVKRELSLLFQEKPHSINIVNDLPKDFHIFADAMYLENVFRNLIENALKYSDNGVRIIVTLRLENDRLQVRFEDNGWGIARKYQKKLFTQFYQVPREPERLQRGYGIGLVQVKYIINVHGGEITVTSVENKGSTFTCTLPLK